MERRLVTKEMEENILAMVGVTEVNDNVKRREEVDKT